MTDNQTALFDFSDFPVLLTERLRLREIHPEDAEAIFAIRGDYEVTKYNTGAAYTHVRQAADLIDAMTRLYDERREIRWGITLKTDPAETVIGMCGYNYWDRTDHRGSIGFDLARAYWRQGIMSEAVQAVVAFGFLEMGLNRVEADASIYNQASIQLLKSVGFTQEGVQREQYYESGAHHDLVLFALLRREWAADKG
jgi:[ribosomal protein S5]-alanine N-acetyltransferase